MAASGHKRPVASVEPHASFAFSNKHSPEQQVAALGPMSSTWDRFRFLKNSGMVGSRALNSRRHKPRFPEAEFLFCKNQKIAFLGSRIFFGANFGKLFWGI
jgi:hypothetical protein